MEERNMPTLRGFISYDGSDYCQIAVWCPECDDWHYHGWPSRVKNARRLEHRFAHCHDRPGRRRSSYRGDGYRIGLYRQSDMRRIAATINRPTTRKEPHR